MRICSLLPSATEIVCALGKSEWLVGVSHECDYPPAVSHLPKVTRSNIPSGASSREIDSAVGAALETEGTLYALDLPLLERLQPDLILTQRLCDVCAVSFDRVQEAAMRLSSHPQVLNLEPISLEEIFQTITKVAHALGDENAGKKLTGALNERVAAVRNATRTLASRPRVFCMEWVDPPYCGGHWMKELVEIAGGRDSLANHRRPSCRVEWKRVIEFDPEIIVLICCGFELERNEREVSLLMQFEGAGELAAVKSGLVVAADGSHYFARPGPRIVDSLEILAHVIHPEIFAAPPLANAFRAIAPTEDRII